MRHHVRIVALAVAALLVGGCTKPKPPIALINAAMNSTNVVLEMSGQDPIPLSTGEMTTFREIVQRLTDHPGVRKKALPTCYGFFRAGDVRLGWTARGLCIPYDSRTQRCYFVEDPRLKKMAGLYTLKRMGPPPVRSLSMDQWHQVLAMMETPK